MAFQVDRNADSATPNKRAATMRSGTSTVSAIIIIGTATIALPTRRMFFSSSSVGTNTKGYGQEQHCPLESQEKSDNSGANPDLGEESGQIYQEISYADVVEESGEYEPRDSSRNRRKESHGCISLSSQRIPQATRRIPRLINQSSSYKLAAPV